MWAELKSYGGVSWAELKSDKDNKTPIFDAFHLPS